MEAPLPVGCNAWVEAVRPPSVCEEHYGHCLQHSESLGKERRTSSQEGLAPLSYTGSHSHPCCSVMKPSRACRLSAKDSMDSALHPSQTKASFACWGNCPYGTSEKSATVQG